MLKDVYSFELVAQDDKARLGLIKTKRGIIKTPAFMPVGTQGTVKGLFADDILKTKTDIILGNTYHLLLRPGIEVLKKFNGLHDFMNWQKPILTDSGGYQIMSLSKFNRIVHHIAERPQIQEEMTRAIADRLSLYAKTKHVAVIVKAEHHCMTHRGVREHESDMTTAVMKGAFLNEPPVKQEFYDIFNSMKGHK